MFMIYLKIYPSQSSLIMFYCTTDFICNLRDWSNTINKLKTKKICCKQHAPFVLTDFEQGAVYFSVFEMFTNLA